MAEQAELMKLLQGTALGDQNQFAELYKITSPALFGLCIKMLKRRDWAEEVLQEAFIKVWHHASEYHPDRGAVSTWLTSIVRYRALDRLRVIKPTEMLDEQLDYEESGTPTPLTAASLGQELNALQLCLDELSDEQKDVIVLSFMEGLTHQELTARVSRPLGTVKSWIRRGLQSLRRCLER
ncbi:MAG: sigma-70 family RNA polymerase sigma factor [Pseudomonadales bacterium]|uniref:RNA polymerase sigma factor n=1 Tax=Oleiphilus messinensis TaxID=141451 RepID=A0A1Y0I1C2_9GAMM|nr:sigma-70 family RNA polymerase sigma factor [Oleiphilus messinensis]ARU54257.1 ECF subfamily RNA polymerase sigma-24 subunit [Oleiphilus messinensis]MCG8613555.1 sigma-70 family RNA polymerase sigma factor [Pseudomonadales bacterium]